MIAVSEPTVFIVDDDLAVRDSLKQLLGLAGLRTEVYASAEDFLESNPSSRPACLMLDVRMSGMGGVELHERLLDQRNDIPVLIITGHGDVAMARQSFRMGAADFMEKPFDSDELLQRIRSVLEHDARAMREKEAMAVIARGMESLSEPERQVMDLLIEGHLNKNIASLLNIAERTVEDRRARIFVKMNFTSLAELVRAVERWRAWNSRSLVPCTSP